MREYDNELLEPIETQAIKALKSINNFVDSKEKLKDMRKSIAGIFYKGLINYYQFRLINLKLDSICNLLEYYQEKAA